MRSKLFNKKRYCYLQIYYRTNFYHLFYYSNLLISIN